MNSYRDLNRRRKGDGSEFTGHPRVGIDRRETRGKAIGTSTAVSRIHLRYR